ncbi:hypothetical protein CSOJ01_08503 [Colletotrichum sojae]|uniref:Uncharacterized protein n=1 Tax=Colletotrichum sojae TaxID=2175907 RepID=A0A8H6MS23_9PEZI|nr:hypothetical protein CSOJ01_08503 [Colletotrichum sojae]
MQCDGSPGGGSLASAVRLHLAGHDTLRLSSVPDPCGAASCDCELRRISLEAEKIRLHTLAAVIANMRDSHIPRSVGTGFCMGPNQEHPSPAGWNSDPDTAAGGIRHGIQDGARLRRLGDHPYERDTASALTLEEEEDEEDEDEDEEEEEEEEEEPNQHVQPLAGPLKKRDVNHGRLGQPRAVSVLSTMRAMPRHDRPPEQEPLSKTRSSYARVLAALTAMHDMHPVQPCRVASSRRQWWEMSSKKTGSVSLCFARVAEGGRRGASVPFHPDPMRVNVLLRHDRCVAGSRSGGRRKTRESVHSRREEEEEEEEEDGSKEVEVTNYWGILALPMVAALADDDGNRPADRLIT